MLHDVVKFFDLEPERRWTDLIFSDTTKIRNPAISGGLALKKNTTGFYPTDANLFVRGPLFQPGAVRQWLDLDATFKTPKDTLGNAVTAIRYKVNDGTDDLYWTGAAWAVAGLANWNTLADVQTNLATFPTAARKIRLVVNLSTTDKTLTPTLRQLRLLWKAEMLGFDDELLFRTLVPWFKANVAPRADLTVAWPGGTTFDLDSLTQVEPLVFADVDGAWNVAADPNLLTNLKSSYDTATKVLTLTSAVALNTKVRLRVAYTPEVVVATHPDFNEIARIPALVLDVPKQEFSGSSITEIGFVHRTSYAAKALRGPLRRDWRLTIRCLSARQAEVLAMSEAVVRALRRTPIITSAGLDERFDAVLEDAPMFTPSSDLGTIHESRFGLRVRGLDSWLVAYSTGSGVRRILLSGDMTGTLT